MEKKKSWREDAVYKSVVQSYVLVLILNHLMWAHWLILQGTIPELVIFKKIWPRIYFNLFHISYYHHYYSSDDN